MGTRIEPCHVLVTGGAGFIGSHLVERLVARGDSVCVVDNLRSGAEENLAFVRDKIQFVKGDVRDVDVLKQCMVGVETVYHLAAVTSPAESVESPFVTHDVNVTGTLQVLLACRDAGVGSVVYSSSASVYGEHPELPKREESPVDPRSPYALSKLLGEQYCLALGPMWGIRSVALRYFNVFGPRQREDSQYASIIPIVFARLNKGVDIPIYGDGKQTRDFVSVASIVDANIRAAESEEAAGGVINIASGEQTSILDVARLVGQLFDTNPHLKFLPVRPGDIRDSWADISKARRLLDLKVETLRGGLQRMFDAADYHTRAASEELPDLI